MVDIHLKKSRKVPIHLDISTRVQKAKKQLIFIYDYQSGQIDPLFP